MWPLSPFPLIKLILHLDYYIAMSLVSLSPVSLLGNNSHCCQGIFLKEESHCVTPFVKPLWNLLPTESLNSWARDCLTWSGLLLTPLQSSVHLCSPHPKATQAISEILQALLCLLIVAVTEMLAPYLDAWSSPFWPLWTNWNVNHLLVLPGWCHGWPSFSSFNWKYMRVYKSV